jgi:hypothetical protein
MKRNTLAMAALGLGAAFLMRNKDSRGAVTHFKMIDASKWFTLIHFLKL